MYEVALVNMPFASAEIPSIALTQLKAVLGAAMGGQARCQVLYPNLDFFTYLDPLYDIVSNSTPANTSGLGDWFFSQAAFPEKPDNPEAYLVRHFSEQRAQLTALKGHLLDRRRTVGAFLDQLIDTYRLDRYSLVGFTSMFCQNVASIAMARRLKQRNPGIVIVMGGANCEAPMGHVIARNVPAIDFVFSGPALRSFPELVSRLAAGRAGECDAIRGVLSRQKAALPAPPGGAMEIGEELDIDVDVALDFDDYFAEADRKLAGAHLDWKVPFETSRGCWWGERSHCTFCGLNGASMKYRAMQPGKALALLHDLFAKYGSRAPLFQSVDNILPREYLTEVLPHLDTPAEVELFYEVKADLKEREIAALARARVTRIQPGIEALATSTLKLMGKGTTSFQNLKFLKHCLHHRVMASWNLLVGFPNEPEEVYKKYCQDLPLLVHLEPPTGTYTVRFDRFSPYHRRALEYGLRLKAASFYEMIYPFPAAELEDLAYFFLDEDFNAAYLKNTAKWLGKLRQLIDHWQQRWSQGDGRLKPVLAAQQSGGRRVIYDSRSGDAREHELSPLGWRVIEALNEQHRLSRLAEKLEPATPAEVESEVAALTERGLLFEDDGLFLSLVAKPPAQPAVPLWQVRDAAEEFNFA